MICTCRGDLICPKCAAKAEELLRKQVAAHPEVEDEEPLTERRTENPSPK